MTVEVSVAVLAGGQSSRMGQNKALLSLHGTSLIEHVLNSADHITPGETFIVTNSADDYAHLPYRTVTDTRPGHGAISGIISALHHSTTDMVLVIACDMPFVKPDLLTLLCNRIDGTRHQAIVPLVEGYPQGVLAIYHRSCLPHMIKAIQSDQRKLKHIIASLDAVHRVDDWQSVDPDGHSFININNRNDLASAREQ